jgi:hypothetical protein
MSNEPVDDDLVYIDVNVQWGWSGVADDDEVHTIARAEWEAKTPEEQKQYKRQLLDDLVYNTIDTSVTVRGEDPDGQDA